MTSPSEFQDGETVWGGFAYVIEGKPFSRIFRATWGRTTDGFGLLHFDDGRAEICVETNAFKVFRTQTEAVEHCVRIFFELAQRLRDAARELALSEEPGDPAAASVSAAGTAPPEVAL